MLSLELLGPVSLTRHGTPVAGPAAQRRRLALLAVLAAAPAAVPREKLVWYLWPDADPETARRFLADSVYALRKALGSEAIVAVGDSLQLDPLVVRTDVAEFRDAAARGDWRTSAALYRGPFLDGFVVPDTPEFERWAEETRADLARVYAGALEQLARGAEASGDHAGAAEWWRRLQAADPYSGRVALALISALAAAGDRAAALRHAQAHEALLRAELDIAPDPAVLAAVEQLRASEVTRVAPTTDRTTDPPRTARPPASAIDAPNVRGELRAPATTPPMASDGAPVGRIRRTAVVTGGLAALLFLGWGAVASWPTRRDDRERVLVAVFQNRTGDPSLDPIGDLAADWMSRGLLATGAVEVVSPSWVTYGRGDTTLPALRALAARAAATMVISGDYSRIGDSLRLQAHLHQAARGTLLHSLDPLTVHRDSALVAIDQLLQRLATSLAARRVAADELREVTIRAQPPTYAAYLKYLEGVRLFSGFRVREAEASFERAWTLDTTFDLARLYSALVALNMGRRLRADSLLRHLAGRREHMGRFDRALLDAFEAEQRGDRIGGLRAMRAVADMTPGSQFTIGYAVMAVEANRPREALAALSRLDPSTGLLRENPRLWDWLTISHHLLGQHKRELEEARRARRTFPHLPNLLAMEIRALVALGRVSEVERLLGDNALHRPSSDQTPADVFRLAAAELRAHGHEAAAMRSWEKAIAWYHAQPESNISRYERALVLTLYEAGRWDEAHVLLERHRAHAANGEALWITGLRGTLAARRGDHDGARLIEASLPSSSAADARGAADLWRARIAAQLGEPRRAVQLFREALEKGAGFGMWVHLDQDLAPIQRDPAFAALARPIE